MGSVPRWKRLVLRRDALEVSNPGPRHIEQLGGGSHVDRSVLIKAYT